MFTRRKTRACAQNHRYIFSLFTSGELSKFSTICNISCRVHCHRRMLLTLNITKDHVLILIPEEAYKKAHLPTTIKVNSKPFLTDFLWTWFGRLAKPTYPGTSGLTNCNRKGKCCYFK